MNKFYLPEIGDEITLQEDWTFELHAERRNDVLGEFFGYKNCWGDWIKISDHNIYDDFTHRMENESIPDFNIRGTEWRKELDKVSVKKITVTIPKGWIEKAKKLKQ